MRKNLTLLLFALVSSLSAQSDKYVYIYQKGIITYQKRTDLIDSVSVNPSSREFRFYDKSGALLYASSCADIDSMAFRYDRPVADLLDVEFSSTGKARDVSPMNHTVQLVDGGGMGIYKNARFNRYAARFDNNRGVAPVSYYKIDYSTNAKFKMALANGHSFETIVMSSYPFGPQSLESKWFSAHQGGGTGMSVLRGTFYFLPNVSTTGSSYYIELNSGVNPQPGVFYHIVGVWNKAEAKAYVYVNGELKGTMSAEGNLVFPSNLDAQWFGIGGDPKNATAAEMGWLGDVVMARLYDKPLSANDVTVLWNDLQEENIEGDGRLVRDVDFVSGLPVKQGQRYELAGHGFQKGDVMKILNMKSGLALYTSEVIPMGQDSAYFVLPQNLQSGRYRLMLTRGSESQHLGWDSMTVVTRMPKVPLVNSHRGFWNAPGSAQNSRTSLRKAIEIGSYNSELDLWLTSDDSLVVNHDATLNGVTIQTTPYETVKMLTLSNGERIPRFAEMLDIVTDSKGMRFLVEIKTHSTAARTRQAARAAMLMVQAWGLDSITDYCSFSLDACQELLSIDARAVVFHISSQTPATVEALGLGGLSMQIGRYRSNPTWAADLRSMGKLSVAWTLNSRAELIEMANAEIDVLATDLPLLGMKVRDYYRRHQDD
ncbi:MAG: hypothetical protein ILA34_06430 [Bacteroidaceae bacterium]|nr:hypothetical protein [Bacteroidaceae bacterium]